MILSFSYNSYAKLSFDNTIHLWQGHSKRPQIKHYKGNPLYNQNAIWAAAWDFQQFDILTNVDSDEPLQPHFKLRNSKRCSVSSLPIIEYSSDWQRLWSDCAYVQANWGFAGRTYHIVGNLMHWLIYYVDTPWETPVFPAGDQFWPKPA